MKESLFKSIIDIMAFFDFEKVAEIEETCFGRKCENEDDKLVYIIKEYVSKNLYEYAKKFSDKDCNYWTDGDYHLHFEYVYDEDEPYMELKYIPISWGEK